MTQATADATAPNSTRSTQSLTPVLAFREGAEEAINLYVSLFPNSRVVSVLRSTGGPIPKGQVMTATFELDGRPYNAFDGGEHFAFSDGFSLMVTCESQEEIDRLWNALTAGGGEPGRCGWLKDRFGLSWQIAPSDLGQMLSDPAAGNPQRAAEAMMQMSKLDIAGLRAAYATPA